MNIEQDKFAVIVNVKIAVSGVVVVMVCEIREPRPVTMDGESSVEMHLMVMLMLLLVIVNGLCWVALRSK